MAASLKPRFSKRVIMGPIRPRWGVLVQRLGVGQLHLNALDVYEYKESEESS